MNPTNDLERAKCPTPQDPPSLKDLDLKDDMGVGLSCLNGWRMMAEFQHLLTRFLRALVVLVLVAQASLVSVFLSSCEVAL